MVTFDLVGRKVFVPTVLQLFQELSVPPVGLVKLVLLIILKTLSKVQA
jgi:hypothetical protein